MPRKKKDKYISDFVSIDDVCANGVTAIWSGVGSGKNSLIEGFHAQITNKEGQVEKVDVVGLAEKYRVLLITSRKAKVTETAQRHAEGYKQYLTDIRHLDDVNFDEYDNKSLVCTTAHIKSIIVKEYSPSILAPEPFWKKFDFVVVDEFHSLIDDATFSDAAFIMKCFIDKVYEDCIKGRKVEDIKPKLIFMSGTPCIVETLISGLEYKKYDLLTQAKYIKPKRINFSFYKRTLADIQIALKKGGKVVYYMCMLDKMQEIIEIAKTAGIDESQIAVSVSDKDTIKSIQRYYPDTIYPNIEIVENSLSVQMALPDNIKLFITNSKNKEGINIGTVPYLLVLEHHYINDIIQICGRFRNGINNVVIIYDRQQFSLPISYIDEEDYQREQGILAANNYLLKVIRDNNINISYINAYSNENVKSFIDYIEKQTPFIRYNHFTCRFEMNECYIFARKNYISEVRRFGELMNKYASGTDITLSGAFYNGIEVTYTPTEEPIYVIKRYFECNEWEFEKTVFGEKEGRKMHKDLTRLRDAQPDTKPIDYSKLGNLIAYFGCKKIQYGKAESKRFTVAIMDKKENK